MCNRVPWSQKNMEWIAIEKVIPVIEDYLQIVDIKYNKEYENESPDFVFYNEEKRVAVEVVECHPSVIKSKKDNAPVLNTYQRKVCEEFLRNEYLLSITEKYGLNIMLYPGPLFGTGASVNDVCSAIESHLKALVNHNKTENVNLIRSIKVRETLGKNIVQFNNTSRVDSICCSDLNKSIKDKQSKFAEYSKKNCDEYWLCIYLPFEEKRHAYDVDYNNQEKEFKQYLESVSFQRICVTSMMHDDVTWLKGNPNYL